ncbi:MAG: orotidine-5'-phosphate decarboxylase [archaeon GW2011_AR10]|nr:MAG: orotidine-5'-phosphate decarboxylase [archaeon GW2011_AR10]
MSWPINKNKSIIPACDFSSLKKLGEIVETTHDLKGVGAYKIGFQLALSHGLPKVVKEVREFTDKPIIYDHQKAGTDIPETGKGFSGVCSSAGIDAVILFPFAGIETEAEWILACREARLGVIVGGEMTHKGFLEKEGGFISEKEAEKIYFTAIENGVKDFVVPGNKPEKISHYRKLIDGKVAEATLYSPGLVAQGGKITDSGKAAGKKWHAIVGRAIYESGNPRKAAEELSKELK